MKTIINTTITAAAILLSGISGLATETRESKSGDFKKEVYLLEISGFMTINDQKTADYMVYIFQDGILNDSFYIDNRHEQYFGLEFNHDYTLKFTKEGYKNRLMLVDTHLPETAVSDHFTFRYEIEFIANDDQSNTFDDFPVAYVTYDAKKKDFDYNRTYHYNVRYNAGEASDQTVSQPGANEVEVE